MSKIKSRINIRVVNKGAIKYEKALKKLPELTRKKFRGILLSDVSFYNIDAFFAYCYIEKRIIKFISDTVYRNKSLKWISFTSVKNKFKKAGSNEYQIRKVEDDEWQ